MLLQGISKILEHTKTSEKMLIFEITAIDMLKMTPYSTTFVNFSYGMPWHAGIPELWHTIKSELNLNLRNGFRRVELV